MSNEPAQPSHSDDPNKNEARYRLLVDNIKDYAIFLMDPTGIIQTWNPGAEAVKGYRPEEIIGRSFTCFYTEEDLRRNHPQSELEIAIRSGRYEEEGWRVRRDGSKFWANVIITRLNDVDGRHIGFAKITRDLTDRRKNEEALREGEERFRLIIDSVRDYAIITLDPDGYVTGWNEGARRLKGYEAAEIAGKHFSVFYEAEEAQSGKCEYELREAAATGRFEDEGWRLRKDGTRFWANVVITALRDSNGTLRGYSKVTRDMTERKRAEDKLRMAHESLEKRVVERTRELQAALDSRDEFISIASHELRTPLTALRLQQQLFDMDLAQSRETGLDFEKGREISQLMARQIHQLSRLVEDMLDVSRIATGRMRLEVEDCDLAELISREFASFGAQFQSAGIQTRLDVEEDLVASCDSQRLEQVMGNLMSNAIKYGGGTPVEVTLRRRGRYAEIVVKDRGPGIEPADHERIFQRFERAISANEASGLGLGLFICRQIIESHGGNIWVESEPGKGSAFIINIPLRKI